MFKKSLWEFLILLFLVFWLASGCDTGANTPADDDQTVEDEMDYIAPPENLIGTIALNNGLSAVMELQFASSSGARAGSVSVSGKIRYDGANYNIGGLYNEETGVIDFFADNTVTLMKFIFMGTYSAASGFSGTVTLYSTINNSVQAQGSVCAVGTNDADLGSIKVYTGTYGGDEAGTWNGTLTSEGFYGSYASYGGDDSGSFYLNRSGDTIFNTLDTLYITGTVSGETLSGRWQNSEDGVSNGTWTGAVVDSEGDPAAVTSSMDNIYLSNLISQAYENGKTLYGSAVDSGSVIDGAAYQGITHTYDTDGSTYESDYFEFSSYTDAQTGLSLAGIVFIYNSFDGIFALFVDSAIEDSETQTDNGGLIITLPGGGGTVDLYVELINDGYGFTGSWEVDGADITESILHLFE